MGVDIPKIFRSVAAVALFPLLAGTICAADRKPARGEGSDASASITATVLDAEAVRAIFNTDFDNQFTVLEVRLEPKAGKTLDVHLDDFQMRSTSSGERGGAFAASQIGGPGVIVVHRISEEVKDKKGKTHITGPIFSPGGGAPPPRSGEIDGARNEVKDDAPADPAYEMLKKKILEEKTAREPETGLLFFPLEKEKPKDLILTWTTPSSKLGVTFK